MHSTEHRLVLANDAYIILKYRQGTLYLGLHNEFLILQHSQLNASQFEAQFEAHKQSLNLQASMLGGPVFRFDTVNVLEYQHHVCVNDITKVMSVC